MTFRPKFIVLIVGLCISGISAQPFPESDSSRDSMDQQWADRYNLQLAGHFPFGPLSAWDADRRTVCDYLEDLRKVSPIRIRDTTRNIPATGFYSRQETINIFLSEYACSKFNKPIRIRFQPWDGGS